MKFLPEKIDTVIYCDGFLKFKDKETKREYRNGCSIAVLVNDNLIKRKRFEIKEIKAPRLKAFFNKQEKITPPMMEYFALYNALKESHKYEGRIYIYSDAQLIVEQMRSLDDPKRYDVQNKVLKTLNGLCRKIKPDNVDILWIRRNANVSLLGH